MAHLPTFIDIFFDFMKRIETAFFIAVFVFTRIQEVIIAEVNRIIIKL